MGGKPSKSRKLTIENDDPTSVIKVSDELVDRLKGNQAEVRYRSQIDSGTSRLGTHQGIPSGAPLPFLNEPSLTTIQLRQAQAEELKKNDEYWEKRINDLQASHKKMQEIMEMEYNKAIGEIKVKKQPDSKSPSMPPCVDNKNKVMECYKKYPNEPMRCAKEVQAFAECVDMKRATLIANRG